MPRKRMIERCPLVTDEEDKMTIEEIEEMYDAAKLTPEQISEITGVPFSEIDFEPRQFLVLGEEEEHNG